MFQQINFFEFLKNTYRIVYYFLILSVYKFVFKGIYKDRKRYPIKEPFYNYQIIDNINSKKFFQNKLILPYQTLLLTDRQSRDIVYETLEVKILEPFKTEKLNFKQTNKLVLAVSLLDKTIAPKKIKNKIKISYGSAQQIFTLNEVNKFFYLTLMDLKKFSNLKIESSSSNLAISTVGKPSG